MYRLLKFSLLVPPDFPINFHRENNLTLQVARIYQFLEPYRTAPRIDGNDDFVNELHINPILDKIIFEITSNLSNGIASASVTQLKDLNTGIGNLFSREVYITNFNVIASAFKDLLDKHLVKNYRLDKLITLAFFVSKEQLEQEDENESHEVYRKKGVNHFLRQYNFDENNSNYQVPVKNRATNIQDLSELLALFSISSEGFLSDFIGKIK